jgi:putative nucleotidyltransferase with HDIG domain
MDKMKLPTRKKAIKLLHKYKILPNILRHSLVVNKVANYLAKQLKDNGVRIDLEIIDRASLLHDIGKSITILEGLEDRHHILAQEILTKEGYPALGLVCRRHSLREIKNINTWEERVIKYSDTRVRHDKIVSIRERMSDLRARYKVPKKEFVPMSEVLKLEREIYSKIDESPDALKNKVKNVRQRNS